jgi:8-oxo-dGTP pyrophosphatase MutT (NUDIX family)
LVQTRGGRWIFPKGGVEPGLTRAQSAALEAFEEAGVHGRIEAIPFARYFRREAEGKTTHKKTTARRAASPAIPSGPAITAHLCEVSRLEKPQELNRYPTWFTTEEAKHCLLQDRAPEFGVELATVVDRAAARIRRLHGHPGATPEHKRREPLHEIHFEAGESRFIRPTRQSGSSIFLTPIEQVPVKRVRRIRAGIGGNPRLTFDFKRPLLQLSAGTTSDSESLHNVTAIDTGRVTRQQTTATSPGSKRRFFAKAKRRLVKV